MVETLMFRGGGSVSDFKQCTEAVYEDSPTTAPPPSKHELERRIAVGNAAKQLYREKYLCKKFKGKKRGNIPQVFSDEQLRAYFTDAVVPWNLKHEEVRRRLLRQFFYALRCGEVAKCQRVEGGMVYVEALKKGRYCAYYMPFIQGTEKLFPPYTSTKEYNGAYLSRMFSERLKQLGGEFCQVVPIKTIDGKLMRRFTGQSLRKTAATLIKKTTHDPYKAKVYLRHNPNNAYGATAAYLEWDIEEMREDVYKCFRHYVERLL